MVVNYLEMVVLRDWKKNKLHRGATIREAMKVISKASSGIAIVVDKNDTLLGLITDGDIRRGLLDHLSLDDCVSRVMNQSCLTGRLEDSKSQLVTIMTKNSIAHLPIVNKKNIVKGLLLLSDFFKEKVLDETLVFLFAGGLGTRLKPLTNDCPKPMLNIGNKPILENIINNFKESEINQFCLSVNYKSDMIIDYFGDGERFGVKIDYVEESFPLGTAGSLSLLVKRPTSPIIVMNGDLLTKVDFKELLNFHKKQGASITVCVREHDVKIPYGVVKCKGEELLVIDEKPIHRFFVNAGIYVIEPDVLNYVKKNIRLDMTELISTLKAKKHKVSTFPIFEYWMDIGQKEDFYKAQEEVSKYFPTAIDGETSCFLN